MTLHIDTSGAGRDLFLIHGWGMHGGVWENVTQGLAQHFRVHAIDYLLKPIEPARLLPRPLGKCLVREVGWPREECIVEIEDQARVQQAEQAQERPREELLLNEHDVKLWSERKERCIVAGAERRTGRGIKHPAAKPLPLQGLGPEIGPVAA